MLLSENGRDLVNVLVLYWHPDALGLVLLQPSCFAAGLFHTDFLPQLLPFKRFPYIVSSFDCFKIISDWVRSSPCKVSFTTRLFKLI